jgi:hypothetical protein
MQYTELEKRQFDTRSISNLPIKGLCIKCNKKFEYSNVKKFMRNRNNKINKKSLWQTCQKCWLIINTIEDPNWIKKNSEAQKISQNKPEQIKRNRDGVRKSWSNDRRTKASNILKEKWKNDEAFAKNALKNLNCHNNVSIGFGSGGLKGCYKSIYYDSALELSFVLWCENNSINIRRYDKTPIEYIDENGYKRKYYPDFIINKNDIVEIKGSGLWYRKNYERNILKIETAKKIFDNFIVIFDKDECVKKYYKSARNIHNETYKKENN